MIRLMIVRSSGFFNPAYDSFEKYKGTIMIFINQLCGWKLNRKVNNYYKKSSCIIFIYSILEMYFTTNLRQILVTWEQISMDYSSVSKSCYGSKLHLITSVRGIFQSMDLTKTGIHDVHLSTGPMFRKVKINPAVIVQG